MPIAKMVSSIMSSGTITSAVGTGCDVPKNIKINTTAILKTRLISDDITTEKIIMYLEKLSLRKRSPRSAIDDAVRVVTSAKKLQITIPRSKYTAGSLTLALIFKNLTKTTYKTKNNSSGLSTNQK